MKTLDSLTEAQISALDELVYRMGVVETATGTRRGFRVHGKFYFYFYDAQQAARLIAHRLAQSAA